MTSVRRILPTLLIAAFLLVGGLVSTVAPTR